MLLAFCFKFLQCTILAPGTRKVRVKQQFDGIPIWGSSVTVELDEDGEPTGKANGHILRGIEGAV